MTTETNKVAPFALLVAEDSELDRELLREAFNELDFDVELLFVGDGEELLDYLRRRNAYIDETLSPTPTLILMDLNMPRMNGMTVLRILRADPDLCVLPVIVLSTADDPKQIALAYAQGINAYLSKPERIEDMIEMVKRFGDFWLRETKLPDLSLLTVKKV
jgi:two-component system response regulator